jgi:hypothetical protein
MSKRSCGRRSNLPHPITVGQRFIVEKRGRCDGRCQGATAYFAGGGFAERFKCQPLRIASLVASKVRSIHGTDNAAALSIGNSSVLVFMAICGLVPPYDPIEVSLEPDRR